jgi:hypothetical protein
MGLTIISVAQCLQSGSCLPSEQAIGFGTQAASGPELVRATTNQDGAGLLAAGKIDAFATNKATRFDLADKTPGIKVLPDRWGEERHAIAFPHGREQAPIRPVLSADEMDKAVAKWPPVRVPQQQ